MKWKGRQRSSNVEDRRGQSSGGGGGMRLPFGKGKMGLGGIIVVGIIIWILGGNPLQVLQGVDTAPSSTNTNTGPVTGTDEDVEFVSVVLKETEDVWHNLFEQQLGKTYQEPTLVLFSGSVNSACGYASAATGPFYCPGDQKVYIDLAFYEDLRTKFGAPGDFAMAYVVAHEVGHHVQTLLGTSQWVHNQHNSISKEEYNKLSVRLELQADFYAGVWAHYTQQKGLLEKGDIDEALNAAHQIGDDHLQKEAQGYVVPDAFTHGTSEQRMRWFQLGYQTGDVNKGNTFEISYDQL